MSRRWLGVASVLVGLSAMTLPAGAMQSQTPPPQTPPPVPKPFPGSTPPTNPATPPAKPNDPPAAPVPAAPSAQTLAGAPLYPAADYLDSYDAGRGQKYFLYGTNAPYLDIVAFYKQQLGGGGRELFRTPPMQQFDLGRFDEDTMAYPPSVVVKDYTWNGGTGYLFVSGTTEKRYRTIIQIVPAVAK
jgi:hypothetical protein